ncbi:MAG: hypothetical protein P8H38_05830 [Flavobacteriaceae bacterium]|nr:hypothetical protein [Flavobacteriaceae bacterium]
MSKTFNVLLIFFSFCLAAQNNPPNFDGIINSDEWHAAEKFEINYEIDPGNNVPSPHLTEVFISYTETDLYVGFIAFADMENLRSSVRNRDEGFQDEMFLLQSTPMETVVIWSAWGPILREINWTSNYYLTEMMI